MKLERVFREPPLLNHQKESVGLRSKNTAKMAVPKRNQQRLNIYKIWKAYRWQFLYKQV